MTPHIDFPGREEALRKVTRYSMYSPMFYRTNLWTHSKHVSWLTQEIAPFAKRAFGDAFNEEKATYIAIVHDDHEIIMGDFQAGNKAILSAQQTAALHKTEEEAIDQIVARFPKMVGPYNYEELLRSAFRLDCLEALVVKYVDKFEAFGEALHEVFGGNPAFACHVVTPFGNPPTPLEYYPDWFASFPDAHPEMRPLLESGSPLFVPIEKIDGEALALRSAPHTMSSLILPNGHHHYDFWKQTILKCAVGADVEQLILQIEF